MLTHTRQSGKVFIRKLRAGGGNTLSETEFTAQKPVGEKCLK